MRTHQPISFHINYFTQYGQSLFLAGSLWNNWQEFIPMRWGGSGRWELAYDAPLLAPAAASVIEYKYIVCDQSRRNILWESSGNRKLVVASSAAEKLTLVVNDVWDFPSQTSFAWKQTESDPSTFFASAQINAKSENDDGGHFQGKCEGLKNEKVSDEKEEKTAERGRIRKQEREKVVYDFCEVDENRIRKINAMKRKKMIAERDKKKIRRPPTVHVPSPLAQSTSY